MHIQNRSRPQSMHALGVCARVLELEVCNGSWLVQRSNKTSNCLGKTKYKNQLDGVVRNNKSCAYTRKFQLLSKNAAMNRGAVPTELTFPSYNSFLPSFCSFVCHIFFFLSPFCVCNAV